MCVDRLFGLSQRSATGLWVLVQLWLASSFCVTGEQRYYQEEDYQDYADDGYRHQNNLYADYANQKTTEGGGGGWGRTLAFGAVTWFLGGKIHSKRAVSKVTKKHQQEQRELYMQYYTDVLALQTQNAELAQYAKEASQRQMDAEFEVADIDHDNKVSRAEFNRYKNAYLTKHPDMASHFPKFEDFDPDSNGLISKDEYDAYYQKLEYM